MSLQKLKQRRNEIQKISAQYKARNIRLFGSVLRRDTHENSDVDLLVTFSDGASILDQVGLAETLSHALGISVDVLSDRGINKFLAPKILNEVKPL